MKEKSKTKSLIVAGGCFWCIEAHMKLADGVVDATSGYSGGESENPTYENYARGGHREVVEVVYDPKVTSFKELVQYYLKDIDPTDGSGSFGDRGAGYAPAVFYETDEEKAIAKEVLQKLEESKLFREPLKVDVLPRKPFWPAEVYHQDYAEKKPMQYGMYHKMSGREGFVEKYWGDDPDVFK